MHAFLASALDSEAKVLHGHIHEKKKLVQCEHIRRKKRNYCEHIHAQTDLL